jgi:hypothetical protein
MNFDQAGTAGLRGYFPKDSIKQALIPFGLDPGILDREINYLLAAQCVVAEHLRNDSVSDTDLLRLGPAGFVHLDLLGNINYLAAVAEDTLFSDRLQAENIAQKIRSVNTQLSKHTTHSNASDLVAYLEELKTKLLPDNGAYMAGNLIETLTNLEAAREAVRRMAKAEAEDPWFAADKRFLRGHTYQATIVNTTALGHFVEFDGGIVGLVHASNFGGVLAQVSDRVEVTVRWVDVVRRRMGLTLVAVVEEDAGDVILGTHAGQGRLFPN